MLRTLRDVFRIPSYLILSIGIFIVVLVFSLVAQNISLIIDVAKTSILSALKLTWNLLGSISGVKKLNWKPEGTEWGEYYNDTNYSESGFTQKKKIIENFFDNTDLKVVWDLGANIGIFSRISSDRGINTISFDIDPAAVEKNYLDSIEKHETKILPLILDLTNPSPDIGWENQERSSIINRGPVDVVLALALLHHLVISNNLPLGKITQFFKKICNNLIIEFVPKTDSQVKRLLISREDIFSDYTKENFENEFQKFFIIKDSIKIQDSDRILYVMEKKN